MAISGVVDYEDQDYKDADRSILIYYMYISALVGAWYNNFMLVLILWC